MNLLNLYVFSIFFSQVYSSRIPTKKICKDCKYFIGDTIECGKFGDTNMITGKITYPSARSMREDPNKCGEDAMLFENNHFKIITVPYYFFKDNLRFFLPSGVLSIYFFALSYILYK
jgi:hypothetical protein